jgi:RNA polymerase sigma-70 factor (ECF subfamily)
MTLRRDQPVVPQARRPAATADDAALRALWDEHAAAVRVLALRLTGGDHAGADDLVQETLLRAWRHPEALDPARGPLRPWLFTVARRLALDARRARQARPQEVPADVLERLVGEDDVERRLESWLVADALGDLTPAHREVLVQTYFTGHTVAEAAAALRVPAGTVKSRTYYALRALKLALQERGVTP